jgi:signal transduction histidine kinase
LVRWDGKRLLPVPAPAALASHAVRGLMEDRSGRLWAATAGAGVFCRLGWEWVNLTTTGGLGTDSIDAIIQDGEGNFWFGSDRGVFQVRAADMLKFLVGSSRQVNCLLCGAGPLAGAAQGAGGFPSALAAPDGALWFAMNGGLLRLDPFNLKAAPAPRVLLEGVSVDGHPVPAAELLDSDKTMDLGTGVRSLDFSFTAINFNSPEKNQFRHQLEGFDSDWVSGDVARRAHYGPLPPGRYRFRVVAGSADGVWEENGPSVALWVRTPFWRAWWFMLVCGLALVGAIWTGVRYLALGRLRAQLRRSEQRRAIERERTRIAQDMHDEIGAKLTRISFLSEVARQGEEHDPAQEQTPVSAIADTSRELLRSLDKIVWAVNPRNDSLEHLAGYLEQYAREYFQTTPVECRIDVPPVLPSVEITAEVRHNIFLAFEEILGNTLKHAQPARVWVEMSLERKNFVVQVRDDGRGFDAVGQTSRPGHDGLANLQTRLQTVGGRCELTSRPGGGTTVRLICPLAGWTADTISNTIIT